MLGSSYISKPTEEAVNFVNPLSDDVVMQQAQELGYGNELP